MPSFEYSIGEKARVGSRFISRVKEELQRALATEKSSRKLTQQSIADKLEVNRSVVNRQFMGLENMTVRSVAELLWAIGWEPRFTVEKIVAPEGNNEMLPAAKTSASVSSGTSSARKLVLMDN